MDVKSRLESIARSGLLKKNDPEVACGRSNRKSTVLRRFSDSEGSVVVKLRVADEPAADK